MSQPPKKHPVVLSIGVLAWNAEEAIGGMLESLFRQSVFERACIRHEQVEVLVIAHACTDATAALARVICERIAREHTWSDGFVARVIDIPEPGRANAWNRFVHEFSAVEARVLCTLQPEMVFHHRDTLRHLVDVLERRPHIAASTDRVCQDLEFKERKTIGEKLALATAALSGTPGRTSDQLFCLRASVARNLFIPRDLEPAAEDFIREMICTEFLTRDPRAGRIALAPEAAHIVVASTRARDVREVQKRQIMGRTAVHVLVDYLKRAPWEARISFVETLRREEARDPDWLRKLVAAHVVSRRCFWRLYPGALRLPRGGWRRARGLGKVAYPLAALARYGLTLVACARAHRTLRRNLAAHAPRAIAATAGRTPPIGAK